MAWTDPKHLIHWWGPEGFTNTFIETDIRTGGSWRYVMHEALLNTLAAKWLQKFDWTFEVRDGVFHDPNGGDPPMFEVRPAKVLAFGRGEHFTQTRYRI